MCSASVSNGDCNIFNPPSFVHVLVGNLPLQNGEKKNGENFIKDTFNHVITYNNEDGGNSFYFRVDKKTSINNIRLVVKDQYNEIYLILMIII